MLSYVKGINSVGFLAALFFCDLCCTLLLFLVCCEVSFAGKHSVAGNVTAVLSEINGSLPQ